MSEVQAAYWVMSNWALSEEGLDHLRFGFRLFDKPYDAGDGIIITLERDPTRLPADLQEHVASWARTEWPDDDEASSYVLVPGFCCLKAKGQQPLDLVRQRLAEFVFRVFGFMLWE